MKKIVKLLGLLALFSILVYIGVAAFVAKQASATSDTRADAILVLGARSYLDGKYNACLKSRVDHAVSLYSDNKAPLLMMSGGDDIEDQVNEAETMQKIASEAGVPMSSILLEKTATSTYENFAYSHKIMQEKGIDSLIIVTEPFHAARASLIAKKLGLNYTLSSASQSPCWNNGKYLSKYFLKEPFAIIVYKLQGKL